jgi:plastocyanin
MMRFVVLLALVVGPACSRPADAPAPAATSPPAAAAATVSQLSGRAPAGALVTLEPSAGVPMPEGNAVLDQFSKAFVPETLFVRVGQPVVFKNSEDQLHNVTVVRSRTGTGVFNISQNQGDMHTHTFEQAGEYDVTCDVHPGMRATIVASNTPYAVYADAQGAFSFSNITPGRYRLKVSAGGRETERAVEVAGAQMDLGDVRPGSGA